MALNPIGNLYLLQGGDTSDVVTAGINNNFATLLTNTNALITATNALITETDNLDNIISNQGKLLWDSTQYTNNWKYGINTDNLINLPTPTNQLQIPHMNDYNIFGFEIQLGTNAERGGSVSPLNIENSMILLVQKKEINQIPNYAYRLEGYGSALRLYSESALRPMSFWCNILLSGATNVISVQNPNYSWWISAGWEHTEGGFQPIPSSIMRIYGIM